VHRLVVVVPLLLATGCAAFMHAEADHVHMGCVRTPLPGAIDLVLGTAGTATLMATDVYRSAPAYLLIPGTFLASGILYSISEYRCRHADESTPPRYDNAPTPFDWSSYAPCTIDHPTECTTSQTCTLVDASHARCMPS